MVVYADVLVCINIIITYIFLVCVRVFTNIPTSKVGIAVASLIGGFSAFIIFLGDIGIILSLLYKLIVGAVIVTVGFFPRRFKSFVKVFLAFFGVSFLFGGAVFFLQVTTSARKFFYYNGTVYFDMSIKYLIGAVLVIYGLFLAFDFFLGRYTAKNNIYVVSITFRDVTVKLRGMVDTGNGMRDGISGNPVFVADISSVVPLFSFEEIDFLKSGDLLSVPETLRNKYRLLPCATVKGGGLLSGFVPDKVSVDINKKSCTIPKVVVALTTEKLSDGEYDVLLNKNIYDYQWKEGMSDEKISVSSDKNKN